MIVDGHIRDESNPWPNFYDHGSKELAILIKVHDNFDKNKHLKPSSFERPSTFGLLDQSFTNNVHFQSFGAQFISC